MTGRAAGCYAPDGGGHNSGSIRISVTGGCRTGADIAAVGRMFGRNRIAVGDGDRAIGVTGGRN